MPLPSKPTIAFYFSVTLDESLRRILEGRPQLKYYEAGLDVGLDPDPYKSFALFQGRILAEYEKMVDEFGLTVIDGTLPAGGTARDRARDHRAATGWCAARRAERLAAGARFRKRLWPLPGEVLGHREGWRESVTEIRFYGERLPGFAAEKSHCLVAWLFWKAPTALAARRRSRCYGMGREPGVCCPIHGTKTLGAGRRGHQEGYGRPHPGEHHRQPLLCHRHGGSPGKSDHPACGPGLSSSPTAIFLLHHRQGPSCAAWIRCGSRRVLAWPWCPTRSVIECRSATPDPACVELRGFDYGKSGKDYLADRDYFDALSNIRRGC